MEDDQLENKKDFRRMIFIIIGIVVLAGATTAFLLLRKGSKESFNQEGATQNALNSQTASTAEKALFSKDIATWTNYYWPGKVNTHYPSNWQVREKINKDGLIVGLEMVPPTGNAEDTIFIGGDSIKCSDAFKYLKSRCLKDGIQVPFYTNSKNQEVLAAFDLIFQNTIVNEIEK
jgi:hypothetical protein